MSEVDFELSKEKKNLWCGGCGKTFEGYVYSLVEKKTQALAYVIAPTGDNKVFCAECLKAHPELLRQ